MVRRCRGFAVFVAAELGGWIGLARVYLTRGENQRAVEPLERLLIDHPGDRYALQLLGVAKPQVWIGLLVEQRQPRDALRYFEAALRTDPRHADALRGLGMAQLQLGARDEAALDLRRAEQIDPSNAPLQAAMRQLRGEAPLR